MRKKENEYSDIMYDEHGPFVICYSNPDKKDKIIISPEQAKLMRGHSWHRCGKYFTARFGNKYKYLHQFLYGRWVDHKNGDKLENRPFNIREATAQTNNMNGRGRMIGQSGYRGVHKMKNGKWRAAIQITKNNTEGGKFVERITGPYRINAFDAYLDYLSFAKKYHGEWSSVADDFYLLDEYLKKD